MGKISFSYTAGALLRKDLRFAIESFCARNDLDLQIVENKGFFESDYEVVIRGPDKELERAHATLKNWLLKVKQEVES